MLKLMLRTLSGIDCSLLLTTEVLYAAACERGTVISALVTCLMTGVTVKIRENYIFLGVNLSQAESL
jgi:hypothetical protein